MLSDFIRLPSPTLANPLDCNNAEYGTLNHLSNLSTLAFILERLADYAVQNRYYCRLALSLLRISGASALEFLSTNLMHTLLKTSLLFRNHHLNFELF